MFDGTEQRGLSGKGLDERGRWGLGWRKDAGSGGRMGAGSGEKTDVGSGGSRAVERHLLLAVPPLS